MPAKDIFHNTVKNALIKDAWVILRENFRIEVDDESLAMFIDLAAEELICAEKNGRTIAVEVKSFQGESKLYQFHAALGQFLNLRSAIRDLWPDWIVYLAVEQDIDSNFFSFRFIQNRIEEHDIKLIIFDADNQEIVSWRN